jgi:hypothetical protein
MADVATPPAADAAPGKQQIVKPDKPDDDKYKEDLAKAEKEHTAAQEKLVGCMIVSSRVRAYKPSSLAQQAHGKLHRTRSLCHADQTERLQS